MDDVTLNVRLHDGTTVYVSPMHNQTYRDHMEDDSLGGSSGYFITRERNGSFEILAKAASLETAQELIGLINIPRLAI